MTCKLVQLVVFLIIHSFNSDVTSEVEARTHDLPMVPFRSEWYGTLDKRQLQEVMDTTSESNFAEFPNVKRRKLKTNKKVTKKKEEKTVNSQEVVKRKKKNKRKRKKKKNRATRRFVKTTVGDKDSNMTDSKEITSRGKPVDIIVHIKMSE